MTNISIKLDVDDIMCPITGQIYLNPVVAADTFTYEQDAILEWFKEHNTSPITNLVISKNIIPSFKFKKMVETVLDYNPNLSKQQYEGSYEHNKNVVINHIKDGIYSKLLKYIKFDFHDICSKVDVLPMIRDSDDELLEHLIDNSDDLKVYIGQITLLGYMYNTASYVIVLKLLHMNQLPSSMAIQLASRDYHLTLDVVIMINSNPRIKKFQKFNLFRLVEMKT
jgi:hypothetical protein